MVNVLSTPAQARQAKSSSCITSSHLITDLIVANPIRTAVPNCVATAAPRTFAVKARDPRNSFTRVQRGKASAGHRAMYHSTFNLLDVHGLKHLTASGMALDHYFTNEGWLH